MAGFRTLSEFFDDVVEESLGRDYKHIFDPQESLSVKKRFIQTLEVQLQQDLHILMGVVTS